MANKYQHLIDAAQHQFGELGKEQIHGLYIKDDHSCCYLGAYLMEKGDSEIKSLSKALDFFNLSYHEWNYITNWNDAEYSWQEISKRLEKGEIPSGFPD